MIEEAIKHCEEVADKCAEYAAEYRQLAEWLKDYKRLKKQNSALDKVREEIMKLQTYKMFAGEDEVYVEREDVLQIIDKHRTESEV